MSKKDPLWSVVNVLPTDYAGYGGEVPEEEKAGDCSCGCRWAAYLEQSGDWLVCTKPRWAQLPHRSRAWLSQFSPRLGELTWEHQAGHGCFEWGCDRCLQGADDCKCPPDADLDEPPSHCWFCGKGRREVAKLLLAELSPGKAPCAICNECVGLCYDLIGEKTGPTPSHTLRPEQYAALIAWAKKLDDKRVAHQMQLVEPDGIVSVSPELLAVMAVAQELRDRFRLADPPTTWAWSVDWPDGWWEAGDDGKGFQTREAAIAAAHAAPDFERADELWLCAGSVLRPSSAVPSCDTIDIGQWMQDVVEDNYGDEYAEGWPDISPAAEVVLNELLDAWADRWLKPLPWRPTGKPERVTLPPYGADGCICTETVVGKSECPVHGPPPALPAPLTSVDSYHSVAVEQRSFLVPCRPELCSLCGGVNSEGCDMCGGTGQTCATHARSWSLCKDERDKP